ncbi:uncharacterized protein LOC134690849 [Mytilus trossulus]|uniref:uncharacterized protein LOC134690849 n=1 Tax=Mytilus trossulus TaxID=6551 RepID=UPI003005EB7A
MNVKRKYCEMLWNILWTIVYWIIIQRKGHWNIKMDSVNWLSQRIMLKSMKSSHGSSSKEDGYINLQPSLRLHQENKKVFFVRFFHGVGIRLGGLTQLVYRLASACL